ncbi:MAG: NDP-sugar synthase [Bacteroidales bacterium]|nr:NDP-sugar synthase [Bacteroidales bacterium]MBR2607766.1 NTP transferase domain-containing protein [Bacteroidaceae bacterium]
MKFAIIAAGEGSRLAQEGVKQPKPLVLLHGVPIIERLIKIFNRHNAESISIIINSQQPRTLSLLEKLSKEYPLNIVVKDTPSSMHSLYELREYLKGGKFCLTTVDTIFREEEFTDYINTFESGEDSGLMAVTQYIDDEKPLYVGTDKEMNITGFYDTPHSDSRHISGGIYGLNDEALDTLARCIEQGQSRMRNFQRQLIADTLKLKAYSFEKIIDIDHASDIQKAEELISSH